MQEIKSSEQGRIYQMETFGTVDGPGIRFVLFLQGCPLRCLYCHNPDAVDFAGGSAYSAQEAAQQILRYRGFIKSGGVTFSGGEPLSQHAFVYAVMQLLHKEGIHCAIDTSGCEPTERVGYVIKEADLILLDIKAFSAELQEQITGRKQVGTLETLRFCEEHQKLVWIRHVLVPGYTLDEKELSQLAVFLADFRCIEKIELLPFHKLGEPKWERVDREYLLYDTPAVTKEQTERVKELFERHGLTVL